MGAVPKCRSETRAFWAMSSDFDLVTLRHAVEARRVQWHQHALERMLERDISLHEVLDAITNGEVIDLYPADRPHASALILYFNVEPLHVVASLDPSDHVCHVITAYRPDTEHFEPDFRTRRKQR